MTNKKTSGKSVGLKRYRAEGPDVLYIYPEEVQVELSKKGVQKPSRFSAKSFKKDIYRDLKTEKLIALCAASEWGGFTEESLTAYASLRFPGIDCAGFMRAAYFLYEDGYLQKNIIPNYGKHYSFSDYGVEAFNRKDTSAMIEKQREQGSLEKVMFAYHHVEPAPVVKQALFSTFGILKKMYPKTAGQLMELKGYMDHNSCEVNTCVYPLGNNVYFFGFFSDIPGDLQELLDAASDGFTLTHLTIVIVGTTHEYAKEIALRMDQALKEKKKPQDVYYTDFDGEVFYSVNNPMALTATEAGKKFASYSVGQLLRHGHELKSMPFGERMEEVSEEDAQKVEKAMGEFFQAVDEQNGWEEFKDPKPLHFDEMTFTEEPDDAFQIVYPDNRKDKCVGFNKRELDKLRETYGDHILFYLEVAKREGGYIEEDLRQILEQMEGENTMSEEGSKVKPELMEVLRRAGYTLRIEIPGYGAFDTLSDKGYRFFEGPVGKAVYEEKYQELPKELLLSDKNIAERFHASFPSALIRFTALSCYGRMKRMNPDVPARYHNNLHYFMNDNQFISRNEAVSGNATLVFAAILSKNSEDFRDFRKRLDQVLSPEDVLVVIGHNATAAEHLAKWVQRTVKPDYLQAVLYTVMGEDTYRNAENDAETDLRQYFFKTPEVHIPENYVHNVCSFDQDDPVQTELVMDTPFPHGAFIDDDEE